MTRLASAYLATLLIASSPIVALAQPAAPPAQPDLQDTPERRPGEHQTDATTSLPAQPATPDRDPEMPTVTDPMLAPIPPPRHVLSSWQAALKLVRSQNSSLRMAAAQVEQAAGRSRQALAAALPSLTGNASLTRHLLTGDGFKIGSAGIEQGTIPDPLTTWNAGATLRVPVFAPRAWHDRRTARQAIDVSTLDTEDAERLVLASTAEAIVSVVTAERMAEVSRVSLRSALVTLDLNR